MKNSDKMKIMPQTYIEELTAWVKKRESPKQKRDKNLATFLALRTDLKAAIEVGYTVKTIWEHLSETEKISCRYETFLKHIRRHITQQNDLLKPQKKEPPAPLRGFTFNPIPKIEDLF